MRGHVVRAAIFVREFRYDGARARYFSGELNPDEFKSGTYVNFLTERWTEYDGVNAYRDTMTTLLELDYMTGFEPGIGRIRDLHDSPKGDYYMADHLGTTRRTFGPSGGTGSYLFTAFGEPRVANLDGGDNRYGYVGAFGYQAHDEMPFLHVGHRYYDPSIGRFLQRDPIGIQGGTNVYAYVDASLVAFADPSGLRRIPPRDRRIPDTPGPDFTGYPPPTGSFRRDFYNACTAIPFSPFFVPVGPDRRPRPWYCPVCRSFQSPGSPPHLHADPNKGERPASTRRPFRFIGLGGTCFVKGTPIHTVDGPIPVEELTHSALVFAADPVSKTSTLSQAIYVHIGHTTEVFHIVLEEETISATGDHPFWIAGKGWVRARELRDDNCLLGITGDTFCIKAIQRERFSSPVPVFNLTVEDSRTYFVGVSGVLVHNKQ